MRRCPAGRRFFVCNSLKNSGGAGAYRQMAVLDEAAEAEIKALYHDSDLTVARIAARYGVQPSAITQLARRRGWLMRSEIRGYTPRGHMPSREHTRALVAQRLKTVIMTKLEQMEAEMRSGTLTSEDFERDAKSVAPMLSGLDKITARHDDKTQQPKSAGPNAAGPKPFATGDEFERLQREIMERFERIQRRRESEAGSE
jgi:uncharacterized protein YjcR